MEIFNNHNKLRKYEINMLPVLPTKYRAFSLFRLILDLKKLFLVMAVFFLFIFYGQFWQDLANGLAAFCKNQNKSQLETEN